MKWFWLDELLNLNFAFEFLPSCATWELVKLDKLSTQLATHYFGSHTIFNKDKIYIIFLSTQKTIFISKNQKQSYFFYLIF